MTTRQDTLHFFGVLTNSVKLNIMPRINMQIVNIVTYVVASHHVMSPMSRARPYVLVPNIVLGGERERETSSHVRPGWVSSLSWVSGASYNKDRPSQAPSSPDLPPQSPDPHVVSDAEGYLGLGMNCRVRNNEKMHSGPGELRPELKSILYIVLLRIGGGRGSGECNPR